MQYIQKMKKCTKQGLVKACGGTKMLRENVTKTSSGKHTNNSGLFVLQYKKCTHKNEL